ncbi:putative pleckstrin [Trypoxylus dichotomus]
MMKTNVQLMCEDLDQLLKDICDFLSNQINDDHLTESQRLLANKLVQRSKKQLTQISTVSMALSTDDDSSYVDMNKQSVQAEIEEPTYEEGENNEYTPVVCPEVPQTEETVCPYKDLPAKDVDERSEKSGPLERKSRFLLFNNQKRYYAVVKGNWLLLYCARTSPKPADNLNLSYLLARPVEGMRTKAFELVCISSQKTFQFVAQTPKDMAQWVACINKRTGTKEEITYMNQVEDQDEEEENVYEPLKITEEPAINTLKKKMGKPLPPLPKTTENTYILRHPKSDPSSPEIMESYDAVCQREDQTIENEEQEEIYDVIEDIRAKQPGNVKERKSIPPTPPPIRTPLKQIQVKADVSNSDFSDDDTEQVYDVLEQPLPSKPVNRRPPDPEPEQEYDIRKPLPPTPSPITSLKEQMRTVSILSNSTDFSDDDEERIYDILEQPAPKQPNQTTKRPPDPEPEEVYCNLAVHEYKQQDSEPEEEYSNLVSVQNIINKRFSPNPNTNKNQENKEVEENRTNSLSRVAVIDKKPPLLRPALKPKPNIQPKNDTQNTSIDDEEDLEYDCVVSQPNTTLNKNNKTKPVSSLKADLQSKLDERLKRGPAVTPKPLKPFWRH